MNKEKQIEGMALTDVDILANDINQHCPDLAENYCGGTHCVACLANALTAKGYLKASNFAREIFEEIEEGIKAAVSALQFENNPIHRRVKHENYSSLMRFIKTVEKKYEEGER